MPQNYFSTTFATSEQGVSWKELAIFDGFCLVALSYFGGGELPFVSYFTWLARLAFSFGLSNLFGRKGRCAAQSCDGSKDHRPNRILIPKTCKF